MAKTSTMAEKLAAKRKAKEAARTSTKALNAQNTSVRLPCGGHSLKFLTAIVKPEDILTQTFVDKETNTRPQELVESNIEALKQGIERRGQLSPAYGFRESSEAPIEIIDGSRRRMGCHLTNSEFWVLVCDLSETPEVVLTNDDKLQLAKDLSTGKEESLYDFGVTCNKIFEELGSAKRVAEHLNISEASVSRARKAARVPVEILSLFSDYTRLKLPQFEALYEATSKVASNEDDYNNFISNIEEQQSQLGSTDDEGQAAELVKLISKLAGSTKKTKQANSESKTTNYFEGVKKPPFRASRKTTTASRRTTEVFSFRDAPKELVEELHAIVEKYSKS